MSVYVFLGPSLPLAEAEALLSAEYYPPVAMGDIYNIVSQRAKSGDCLLIIDGVFEQVPAVWHKEILFALSQGVHVMGASSMGALRAAELDSFGMRGLGDVYEAYANGSINDDDEVAVAHASAESGYRSLSEAMVNIRAAVADAQQENYLDVNTASWIINTAKALYYPDRNWPTLLQIGRETGYEQQLTAFKTFLRERKPNQKREDAIAALNFLAQPENLPSTPFKAEFVFETTSFWVGLTRTAAMKVTLPRSDARAKPNVVAEPSIGEGRNVGIDEQAALAHLKSQPVQWQKYTTTALIGKLVSALGDELHVSADDYKQALSEFCVAEDLRSGVALEAWLSARQLSRAQFNAEIENRARLAIFTRIHSHDIEYRAQVQSKLDNRWGAAVDYTHKAKLMLSQLGIQKPNLESAGVTADQLQAWYEKTHNVNIDFSDRTVARLGFESTRDYINQLLIQYIVEQRAAA
ncbi:TfuA-like protein [Teredinibacter waterburyi]|jgi:Uncharacterized conserved protein|uniref:TfuA-like protein n=1 Tax=Teredinibacter waterburyi TaxID=1500538 RepID=UPI00165EC5BE|nr:TfuA-like protein [Teredinibacter waterburyi]